jgi:hypothetical protein
LLYRLCDFNVIGMSLRSSPRFEPGIGVVAMGRLYKIHCYIPEILHAMCSIELMSILDTYPKIQSEYTMIKEVQKQQSIFVCDSFLG